MAKKRKLKKPQKEVYRIEIENWEIDHALIGRRKGDFYGDARFGESSYLMMYGKIIWPEGEKFSKAQIFLNSKAEFDDHWKGEDGKEESTVGFMQLSRDKGTLHMTADLPARLFSQIQVSLAADKMKYAEAYGEKLRWGNGLIFNIGFRTSIEDDW